MHRLRFPIFVVVLLIGGLTFSQTPQWSRDAQKLQHSLQTLNILLSVNPFPGDVPGLETAITNKTEQMMDNLATLQAALQTEMSSLSAADRQDALGTLGDLLMQAADVGSMLYIRGQSQLSIDLVTTYNTCRASYYTLSGQFNLQIKRLPQGVILADGGSWIPGII